MASGLGSALGINASTINVTYMPGEFASTVIAAFATDVISDEEAMAIAAALSMASTASSMEVALAAVGNSGAFVTTAPGQAHMQLFLAAAGVVAGNVSVGAALQAITAAMGSLGDAFAELSGLPIAAGVSNASVTADAQLGVTVASSTLSFVLADASAVGEETLEALVGSVAQTTGVALTDDFGVPTVMLAGVNATLTVELGGSAVARASDAQLESWAQASLLSLEALVGAGAIAPSVATATWSEPLLVSSNNSNTALLELTVGTMTSNASIAAALADVVASVDVLAAVQLALDVAAAGADVTAELSGAPTLAVAVDVSTTLAITRDAFAAAFDDLLQSAADNTTGVVQVLDVGPAIFGAPGVGGVANCTVAVSFDNLNAATLSPDTLTEMAASLSDQLEVLPQLPGVSAWPSDVSLSACNATLAVELSGVYDTTVRAYLLRALQTSLATAVGVPIAATWSAVVPGDATEGVAVEVLLGASVSASAADAVTNMSAALASATTFGAVQAAISAAARRNIMLMPVEEPSIAVTFNVTVLTTDTSLAFGEALQSAAAAAAATTVGVISVAVDSVAATGDASSAMANFSTQATFTNIHAATLDAATVELLVSNLNDVVSDNDLVPADSQALSVSLSGGGVTLPLSFVGMYAPVPAAWVQAMEGALATAAGSPLGANTSAVMTPGDAAFSRATTVLLGMDAATDDSNALATLANAVASPATLAAIQAALNAVAGQTVTLSLVSASRASITADITAQGIVTAPPEFNGVSGASALSASLVSAITAALAATPGVVSFQSTPATSVTVLPVAASQSLGVSVRYWDKKSSSYSSAGIVTMPNPHPPNATCVWRSDFVASSVEDLPLAWAMEYPGCRELLVNCSDPAERLLPISLNAQSGIGDPVVTCGVNQTGFMRVFVNDGCDLWHSGGGAVRCLWNISLQAFTGDGCVYAETTKFATVHATDFMVTSAPQIAVASPSDFASVDPAMLKKLTGLITTLAALFGTMHVAALCLGRRDARELDFYRRTAHTAALGCSVMPEPEVEGVAPLHVWRFSLLASAGKVAGPAVTFAALVGVPFARLRFAIPGHLFGGAVDAALAAAIGSDAGFEQAVHYAQAKRGDGEDSLVRMLSVVSTDVESDVWRTDKLPTADGTSPDEGAKEQPLPAAPPPDVLQLSSTALMHALLQSRCLYSSAEVAQAQAAYLPLLARHSTTWPGLYLRLFETYKELLQGTLFSKNGWLLKADAFRVILLAQTVAANSDDCCPLPRGPQLRCPPPHSPQESSPSSLTVGRCSPPSPPETTAGAEDGPADMASEEVPPSPFDTAAGAEDCPADMASEVPPSSPETTAEDRPADMVSEESPRSPLDTAAGAGDIPAGTASEVLQHGT